jgi:hypothetical protein
MKFMTGVFRGLFGWLVLALFWLREIAGWVLLVLGLGAFYVCFVMLVSTPPRIIQVIPLTFVGFILFRGGIHLLKVSAAALVCLRTQEQVHSSRDSGPAGRKPARPTRLVFRTPFELGPRPRAN